MHFGIDAHGGEREGEGNSTYTRNLSRSLVALDGDDTFALFAADASLGRLNRRKNLGSLLRERRTEPGAIGQILRRPTPRCAREVAPTCRW